MKDVKTIAIDLAKNIFQLHGADRHGRKVFGKRLKRAELLTFMAQHPPCAVGMEACIGAHYWARVFRRMGHTVRMIAPQFVKPFVKSNKSDRNDAAAISEAMNRPEMKFVGIKTIEQQDMLLVHRCREMQIKQRTAQANQIRGLLMDYGIIIPKGIHHIRSNLPRILEDGENELTVQSRALFAELYERLKQFDEVIATYDTRLETAAKADERCQRIMAIEGVGPITASAAVATIGDVHVFRRGREMAAWLGLVPKQHSSGDKVQLGEISKRGDRYLRTLLVQGARAVVHSSAKKGDPRSVWTQTRRSLSGYNKAAVAVANKNARIIWALLARGETYRVAVSAAP